MDKEEKYLVQDLTNLDSQQEQAEMVSNV